MHNIRPKITESHRRWLYFKLVFNSPSKYHHPTESFSHFAVVVSHYLVLYRFSTDTRWYDLSRLGRFQTKNKSFIILILQLFWFLVRDSFKNGNYCTDAPQKAFVSCKINTNCSYLFKSETSSRFLFNLKAKNERKWAKIYLQQNIHASPSVQSNIIFNINYIFEGFVIHFDKKYIFDNWWILMRVNPYWQTTGSQEICQFWMFHLFIKTYFFFRKPSLFVFEKSDFHFSFLKFVFIAKS